jgi:hypothetical protein
MGLSCPKFYEVLNANTLVILKRDTFGDFMSRNGLDFGSGLGAGRPHFVDAFGQRSKIGSRSESANSSNLDNSLNISKCTDHTLHAGDEIASLDALRSKRCWKSLTG